MERLLYLVLDQEIYICFENLSEEEWYELNDKSPEQAFVNFYNHWMNIDKNNIREKAIDEYGIDYIENIFDQDTRNTQEIKNLVNEKYNECLAILP